MFPSSRRDFLSSTAALAAGAACTSLLDKTALAAPAEPPAISFGLVTYMWGADWDLPTLLKNCKKTGVLGVDRRGGKGEQENGGDTMHGDS